MDAVSLPFLMPHYVSNFNDVLKLYFFSHLIMFSFFLPAAAVPRRAPTPSGAVMWQEARKHERKLRGMMVDYKRRGERRREYYEKIVRDSELTI